MITVSYDRWSATPLTPWKRSRCWCPARTSNPMGGAATRPRRVRFPSASASRARRGVSRPSPRGRRRGSLDQVHVTRRPRDRSRYDVLARGYEVLLRACSLGSIDRLYQAIAEALDPLPGGTLVELGCGPATVTPHLLEKLEPSGRLV